MPRGGGRDACRNAPSRPGSAALSERLYRGHGALWRSDIALEPFDPVEDIHAADAIAVSGHAAPLQRPALRRIGSGWLHADGFSLPWGEQATFDVIDGKCVRYAPGSAWPGTMPAVFFGTVVAATLAWRGAMPLHASAVELDGRALLIAGSNGAGKSTLAAQLLALGASLIGDDLSVLDMPEPATAIVVRRGRRTVRLHAQTALGVAADLCVPVPGDERGKWAVRPLARTRLDTVPLGAVIVLGAQEGALAPLEAVAALSRHLFRPYWMKSLPGHPERLRGLLAIAARVPVHGTTAPAGFHADDRFARRVAKQAAALFASGGNLPG